MEERNIRKKRPGIVPVPVCGQPVMKSGTEGRGG
jgi:hypothetical protein